MNYELGRLPSIHDQRNLQLTSYFAAGLPNPPQAVNWYKALPAKGWGVMGNNRLGNCVICTAAHIIDAAEANESSQKEPIPDDVVVNLSYEMHAIDGYTILERLKRWRNSGMFDSKIEAFTQLPIQDPHTLKSAIHLFGHADIGVWMPSAWRDNIDFWDSGSGWNYRPGSWGGHSVCLLGYEPSPMYGTLYKAISWGSVVDITEQAINDYVDEIWVSLLPEWYEYDQISPAGFNKQALMADISVLEQS